MNYDLKIVAIAILFYAAAALVVVLATKDAPTFPYHAKDCPCDLCIREQP